MSASTDDEVAGPDKRIDNMNACIRQRPIKLGFQDMFNAVHHEIDNRLGCVDDAVCVRHLHGEPLKKLFIDGVEELLFLGEVLAEGCGIFNSSIERIQRFKKRVATECVLDEYLNDVFNLAGDDIPTREVGVIEDGTEDAFCEQVLDEHLLNGS